MRVLVSGGWSGRSSCRVSADRRARAGGAIHARRARRTRRRPDSRAGGPWRPSPPVPRQRRARWLTETRSGSTSSNRSRLPFTRRAGRRSGWSECELTLVVARSWSCRLPTLNGAARPCQPAQRAPCRFALGAPRAPVRLREGHHRGVTRPPVRCGEHRCEQQSTQSRAGRLDAEPFSASDTRPAPRGFPPARKGPPPGRLPVGRRDRDKRGGRRRWERNSLKTQNPGRGGCQAWP